ncbi:hypothetical protein B5E77_02740 [Lachnoclostridium sp. An131]|uniref:sugar ABC transporter substrate-binding protein n=1 Tax=Lachnoclostridium sp. An131 TaxID=1965555 RepID=UPI000B3B06BF|nr:sugar ABC transporter substrate-binding protein [Lachnoclostridium sp. An131]OUQ28686.1 hypothetical protein B5E77_02740 [Lachnoclostridium sp. An131]
MKTKKKWIAMMLAAVLGVSTIMAGCSSGGGDTQTTGVDSSTDATAETTETTETAEAAETADFVPAAEIEVPEGKRLAVLPVDQVADETVRIAVVGMNTNTFDLYVYEGVEYATQVLADRNCVVDFISIKEHNITEYESNIRSCMVAGYDAICCNGFGEQLQDIISECTANGVPVFIFNNPAGESESDSEALSFWGQSGFEGGKALGELAVEELGGEGKYAIITGNFSLSGHEARRLGFRSVMDEYEGMELVGEYENNDLYETAYELTTNLITANPDISCIYVTAGGPGGAAQAIEDAGLSGEIVMVCHDWMPDTMPFVESGVISGVLDQEPFTQGYAPVIDAFNYLVGGITPEKVNLIEGQIATPENIDEVYVAE